MSICRKKSRLSTETSLLYTTRKNQLNLSQKVNNNKSSNHWKKMRMHQLGMSSQMFSLQLLKKNHRRSKRMRTRKEPMIKRVTKAQMGRRILALRKK